MIDSLHGTLRRKEPMAIVVDVQGVGYLLSVSLHTFDALPAEGEPVDILTVLHVREDAMQLFGFVSEGERQLFRQLQSISGIGPRMAVNILSGCGVDQLSEYVRTGNIGGLTSVPGVGKKTAERIIVELKDKLGKQGGGVAPPVIGPAGDRRGEAIMALVALGYARQMAEQAVFKAMKSCPENARTSELIKEALRQISR